MTTDHTPRIMRRGNQVYGAAYKFVCSCGASTPWMTRPSAMDAKAKHEWECDAANVRTYTTASQQWRTA